MKAKLDIKVGDCFVLKKGSIWDGPILMLERTTSEGWHNDAKLWKVYFTKVQQVKRADESWLVDNIDRKL